MHSLRTLISALITIATGLIFLNGKCRKEVPPCVGKCMTINISGRIYDKTANKGFENIPVEIDLRRKSTCLGCNYYHLATVSSGNDGSFTFSTSIDTSYFQTYYLKISIPKDSIREANYLRNQYIEGRDFDRLDPVTIQELQQISFAYFPKTTLTIKLHRTKLDYFNYAYLQHSFDNMLPAGSDWNIPNVQSANDTTFTIITAADIYTKFSLTKFADTVKNVKTDSFFCKKNSSNMLNIDY